MPRPPLRPGDYVQGRRVNLHRATWEALRDLAYVRRTTISEQVRRAVAGYLAKEQRKGKKVKRK